MSSNPNFYFILLLCIAIVFIGYFLILIFIDGRHRKSYDSLLKKYSNIENKYTKLKEYAESHQSNPESAKRFISLL